MDNANIESVLLATGKITKHQIDEIREMFILVDSDKSGQISYEEITKLMGKLSKTIVNKDDVQKVIEKLDLNKDGIIEWEEFLQAMFTWLSSLGLLRQNSSEDTDTLPNDRKMLHLNMANFFLQFNEEKNFLELQNLFAEHNENLEDRLDSWDFFGTKTYYSTEEKWQIYNENEILLKNFNLIAQKINSTGDGSLVLILDGLRSVTRLLSIVDVFKTPQERFQIAQHIIRLFDLLFNSSVMNKIILFLTSNEPHVVWESLKIVTLFAPGPRLANTPETSNLHQNQMFHKIFLVNNGVAQATLKLTETKCKEVKHQSVLALGFLARNSMEARDLLLTLGAVQTLIGLIDDLSDLELARALAWTLSIMAGVTLNTQVYLSDMTTVLALVKAFTWFLFWKDDSDIITNSLLGLTYLLPLVEFNIFNKNVWERVLSMLTHNTIMVKRAALNCIRNIISSNEQQCQFLVENKLVSLITELLNYMNLNVKIESCRVISLLATKGYIWYILETNSVLVNLLRLLYEDSNCRWDALKVLKTLSATAGELNKLLLQNNVIKGVFSNLSGFKDYDKVLSEIYGYLDPSYNFAYLVDCLATLNNLITASESGLSNPEEYLIMLASLLEQYNFDKLQNLIDMLFIDIENKRIDFIQLLKDNNDFSSSLIQFLDNCFAVFKAVGLSDYTKRMMEYLTVMKGSFEQRFLKLQTFLKTYSEPQLGKSLEVRCYSNEGYPDGDNKVLELPINVSLMELLLQVETKYKKSPILLHYIDEFNGRILIENDLIFKKAIEKSFHQGISLGDHKTILKIMVVSPMSKLLRNYLGSSSEFETLDNKILDIFTSSHSNLSNKSSLMDELQKKTNLSQFELEKLYSAFVETTSRRLTNKNDGTVNVLEFGQIMRNFVDDSELVQQIFNSMDINKTGSIDFRDFVCLVSIIKSGSFEDKLRIAFVAYDRDHNGFIDKQELFQLLKTSSRAKGLLTSDFDMMNGVNKVFDVVDKNNDGFLSYTEFKEAILQNQLFINPFWTDSKHLRLLNPTQFAQNPISFGQNSIQFGQNPIQFGQNFSINMVGY